MAEPTAEDRPEQAVRKGILGALRAAAAGRAQPARPMGGGVYLSYWEERFQAQDPLDGPQQS